MTGGQRDVVITGMGAVCAVGNNCAEVWAAVEEGRDGIRPIGRFSTSDFETHLGAEVSLPGLEPGLDAFELCFRFSEVAATEAMAAAGLPDASVASHRIALVFGTGVAGEPDVHGIAERLAGALGLDGPRVTVSTACSSSTAALGTARDLLAMGAADIVVAGGADVLTPEVFAGFHSLGVLSAGKCAPFSTAFGTTLGEGAGFIVLERRESATRRRRRPTLSLGGFGLSGDAWHETSPEPRGAGVERAIRAALADAALEPACIDYVNAHGSATEANDRSEWLGIKRALGSPEAPVPVSSSKGMLGHAQGAAGALEAIVTMMAMQRSVVPPTLHGGVGRPCSPPDAVFAATPRPHATRHVLSTNSAFGGANAAVVISRIGPPRSDPDRRTVRLCGFGASDGAPSSQPLDDSMETRGLDPSSRALVAAAAMALAEAGVSLRGATRDRAGLIVGQLRGSPTSARSFYRSIEEGGLTRLSPAAFARIVLNAAAGSCSKLLSLRGPLSALTTGDGSCMTALILAAEMLSTRGDVDFMVAGGCDESGARDDDARGSAECVVLSSATTPSLVPSVVLAGWGIAGPGQVDAAIRRARGDADGPSADECVIDVGMDDSEVSASRGMQALANAAAGIRAGRVSRVILASRTGRSVTTALLLTA